MPSFPHRRRITKASVLVAGLTAVSCLVTPPPHIEEQSPERPNIDVRGIVPGTFGVINLSSPLSEQQFTVPYSSVDAEQRLWFSLWLNWNTEFEDFQEDQSRAPASSDGTEVGFGGAAGELQRELRFDWAPEDLKPGCNLLTLFLTHEQNYDDRENRVIDFSKAAIVNWWVNFDAPPELQQTLVDCPVQNTGTAQ